MKWPKALELNDLDWCCSSLQWKLQYQISKVVGIKGSEHEHEAHGNLSVNVSCCLSVVMDDSQQKLTAIF